MSLKVILINLILDLDIFIWTMRFGKTVEQFFSKTWNIVNNFRWNYFLKLKFQKGFDDLFLKILKLCKKNFLKI